MNELWQSNLSINCLSTFLSIIQKEQKGAPSNLIFTLDIRKDPF